ncbi:hypothetical protein V2G26_013835 [Clonostachys chloroleuca]
MYLRSISWVKKGAAHSSLRECSASLIARPHSGCKSHINYMNTTNQYPWPSQYHSANLGLLVVASNIIHTS